MSKVKKITSLALALLMLIGVFAAAPITASAQTSGDYQYTVLDDGTAEITRYTGSATELTIPSKLDGYTVTSIRWRAFYYCTDLESVTISNSVTSIGEYAFEGCNRLISVTIPSSVSSIGWGTFRACSSLTGINVDNSNTAYCSVDGNLYNKDKTELIQYAIGKTDSSFIISNSVTSIGVGVFENCSSLASITIPDSVTCIGDYAFRMCTGLTSISIPDSVTSIEAETFEACENLASVIIPESVTNIYYGAFLGCKRLTSVTIPDSVAFMSGCIFSKCSSLTDIIVGSSNDEYCSVNGILYNKDKTELIQYAVGKTDTSFIIPDSVASIGEGAFSGCESLTSVTIPDIVTSIGNNAFEDCTSLTSVTIPDSVTCIGYGAFAGCENLVSLTIPDSVTSIGESAFYGCESLTSVTIPDSVTSIDDFAFGYFENEDGAASPGDSFTIKGYMGSAAEQYANDNGFTFISLGEAPTDEPSDTVPVDTQKFIEAVEAYHIQENVSALDDIPVDEIKNHITVFSEDENTVIFGSEMLEIIEIDGEIVPEYKDINGYRFTSNGFFSVSNPTGYCVYDRAQNKVFGIADAVKEDIVAVETLAEIIPGTTQKTQPVSTDPIDTQPSDTAPVDTTPVATDPADTKPADTTPSEATTAAPTEAPTQAPTQPTQGTQATEPTQGTQPTQATQPVVVSTQPTQTVQPTTKPAATVTKSENTLSAKAKKVTVKANKKTTLDAAKYIKVSKAVGKVIYKLAKGNKKITVAKNGKLTIKKGLKKGTYKIKVKITAAGNDAFEKATKTVSVKIKVK